MLKTDVRNFVIATPKQKIFNGRVELFKKTTLFQTKNKITQIAKNDVKDRKRFITVKTDVPVCEQSNP